MVLRQLSCSPAFSGLPAEPLLCEVDEHLFFFTFRSGDGTVPSDGCVDVFWFSELAVLAEICCCGVAWSHMLWNISVSGNMVV